MAYLYISYERSDATKANEIASWLHNAGYGVWYDGWVDTTEYNLEAARQEGLDNCAGILFIVSAASENSFDALHEVHHAQNQKNKPVLGVILNNYEYTRPTPLFNYYCDYTNDPESLLHIINQLYYDLGIYVSHGEGEPYQEETTTHRASKPSNYWVYFVIIALLAILAISDDVHRWVSNMLN